ncbi:hypothetical protein ACTA71_010026 [Dictyostelium dimigraforme]
MNPQFNQLVRNYCAAANIPAKTSNQIIVSPTKVNNNGSTISKTISKTPTKTTTTTITTTISSDDAIPKKEETIREYSDSFVLSMYEKLLKNSFKNKLKENVFVLYTAKHMDVDEITHHLGGKNQKGFVVEIYPHVYRVCSGKTVRIQSKKKDADKLFLSVVGEQSGRILLLNLEKKSNSGLFKFTEKKVETKHDMKPLPTIVIYPKVVKRLIIYGKETKIEYKERRYLQLLYNESDEYIEMMRQKKMKRRENKEKVIKFIGEAAMKAIPTINFGASANFGKIGSSSQKSEKSEKSEKAGKCEKAGKGEKSEKTGKVIRINKNFNSNKSSKSGKTNKGDKSEKNVKYIKSSKCDQSSDSCESSDESESYDSSDTSSDYFEYSDSDDSDY